MLGLEDAVALVVGAGPGLGTSTARALAGAGAEVILVARSQATIDSAVGQILDVGGRARGYVADLASPDDRAALLEDVAERGGLDVVVCNASVTGENVLAVDADLDEWRRMADINVWAPLALVQESAPMLKSSHRAAVILVSAMTTRIVSAPGRGGYAISKAALNQAVQTLAFELGPDGVRVNAVVPGWMDTPTVQAWRDDPARRPYLDRALEQIPLGSIPHPDDVAGVVLFLASRLSAAVTGELIDANGGQYMRG